jgi:hypothetical protein
MLADEEAQATGRGSVGLAELLADMGEDDMATTAAQNRAVRNVLRRRNRGGVVASQGVTARKQLQQHSRRLTAFDGRQSPKSQLAVTAAAGERMKRIRAEFVSPSHPYFVLTRAAESFGPEAVLPQPYYGISGRLPQARQGSTGTGTGPTGSARKGAAAAAATSVAGVSGSTYDATGGPVAKAVQRAAARHAFFFAHLQNQGCEESVAKTAYRLRHEWRRLTSRQKNTYVPETVRGNVLAAAHGEDLADQVPHVAQPEDDCVVVPPTTGMRLHHIDAEAEALPHFYTVRPRSTVTRLVRTPFQLFTDAHIDTARAEVESREAKANAKAGQSKPQAQPVATAAEEGDEPRAVFTSHAITRAAVHTLAEAWTDLRPADKHAYANMAEGFTASSKRYFDAAFAQLRKIHRQNPGGVHDDADDDVPYDAADPLVPALLKRGRPPSETAGDAQANKAWIRLPVSPVVRRRQEERCGGAHAESV